VRNIPSWGFVVTSLVLLSLAYRVLPWSTPALRVSNPARPLVHRVTSHPVPSISSRRPRRTNPRRKPAGGSPSHHPPPVPVAQERPASTGLAARAERKEVETVVSSLAMPEASPAGPRAMSCPTGRLSWGIVEKKGGGLQNRPGRITLVSGGRERGPGIVSRMHPQTGSRRYRGRRARTGRTTSPRRRHRSPCRPPGPSPWGWAGF